MRRYQVKVEAKDWSDRDPDLLRRRDDAIATAVGLLRRRRRYRCRREVASGAWAPWETVGRRRRVKQWLRDGLPVLKNERRIQVAELEGPVGVAIRAVRVDVPTLAGATIRAETVEGLFRVAWPAATFAGAFVCKRYNGSSDPSVGFSAHAWGDAVDETASGSAAPNDAMTDWAARMAASGNLPAVQVLGSQAGAVVEAKPRLIGSWKLVRSSASSSHLWHVHVTCRDHSGVPPCAK